MATKKRIVTLLAARRVVKRILLSACQERGNTRSKARPKEIRDHHFGLWLSLVERLVRDQEAVGSNPTSPIIFICHRFSSKFRNLCNPTGFKFIMRLRHAKRRTMNAVWCPRKGLINEFVSSPHSAQLEKN